MYVLKFVLGYLIGVVGVFELVFMVLMLCDGVILLILNYEIFDFEIDFDVVVGELCYGDYCYVVNNLFGFGGYNVVFVFGCY